MDVLSAPAGRSEGRAGVQDGPGPCLSQLFPTENRLKSQQRFWESLSLVSGHSGEVTSAGMGQEGLLHTVVPGDLVGNGTCSDVCGAGDRRGVFSASHTTLCTDLGLAVTCIPWHSQASPLGHRQGLGALSPPSWQCPSHPAPPTECDISVTPAFEGEVQAPSQVTGGVRGGGAHTRLPPAGRCGGHSGCVR